jgi:hypothetical protein
VTALPEPTPAPERLLRDDLELGPFTAGVDRGWWRLHELAFPYAIFEIAATPRPGSPEWYALRMYIAAYPQAPSAQPWDVATGGPLAAARWPGGAERIMKIFNPGWRPDALYFPMDALALQGHDSWRTDFACHVWDDAKDITQYLGFVHELLNTEEYTGVRGS